MEWINKSLNRKFILATASGLAISSLTFLLLYMQLYRSELGEERSRTASQVNGLLQTSLENAMLKRDLSGLDTMVKQLGKQPEIVSVFITNPKGEIRFSSSPEKYGKQIALPYKHSTAMTSFILNERGEEVLRSINPVHNKQICSVCHGPVDKNLINGVLYVDYDAAPLRNKVRNTTLLLMSAGALIVILNLTGGWWFIRKYILKPVDHLSQTSQALTHGDLKARVDMDGHDELSSLGQTFNFMAEKLEEKLEELEEQKTFLQGLVDAIPDGVRIIDQDFNVLLTNQAYRAQHAMGNESGVGQLCFQVSHNASKHCPPTLITCPVHEIKKSNKTIKVLHKHKTLDGKTLDVEIFAAPMKAKIRGEEKTLIVESIRDLAREVRYSQEQKLSEIGRLATGVAHEIHNPLASSKLALDSIEQEVASNHASKESILEHLHLINQQIDNCIQITGKLLKLGSAPGDALELVDINIALQETLSLLRWQAEEDNIVIHENLAPELLRVLASDSEIRMVILNLVQNSFHAMPSGGELTITSFSTPQQISISFSDSGVGIKEKDLPYIFDPFFSRRADGMKGTGLGLSISHAIIEKYAGSIKVVSEFSSGSTFSVTLPNASHTLGNST